MRTRSENERETRIDRALARAVIARALCAGLEALTPGSLERLGSPGTKEALLRAARLLGREGEGSLIRAAKRFGACSVSELPAQRERLFGHTLRGKICPYETEYGAGHLFQQAQELADLSGFYRAFGLEPNPDRRERVDHVASELELFAFLSLKEAAALERGDGEMAELTRAAARRFLRDHLGRFGRAFGASLAREAAGGFFGRLGTLCSAYVEEACRELDVPVGPEWMELRSEGEEENVPMACGEKPIATPSFEV